MVIFKTNILYCFFLKFNKIFIHLCMLSYKLSNKINQLFLGVLFIIFSFTSCKKESQYHQKTDSENNLESNSDLEDNEEIPNNEGTFKYEDGSAYLEISIYCSSWSGKTIVKTGFGDAYDSENTEYQNGIVKGNDLYDGSGYVKVGNVDGNSLTTSIGGNRVTLRK